jgi:hypothetical protein
MILAGRFNHAREPGSYEGGSPDRVEQYYGEMHWESWPLLQQKIGR